MIGGRISTGNYKDKDGKTIYTTDVIVEEHEFAQNKDNGAGADSSETQKTDKDGFMEAPEGEVPFDKTRINGWRGCSLPGHSLFHFKEEIKNYRHST